MKVIEANISEQAEEIRHLFQQYYDELLRIDVCFQDFEDELANLEQIYTSPRGELLLAIDGVEVPGCVALRKVDRNLCEMKRLYVLPKYRGEGLGRTLAESIIKRAIQAGYSRMRLDTLDWLKEAINLYKSLGFTEGPAHIDDSPVKLVYLQLDLGNVKVN